MSVFKDKHVLIVGEETALMQGIKSAIELEGAVLHVVDGDAINAEMLVEKQMDIIILDYLTQNPNCTKLFKDLALLEDTKLLQVFAMVNDNQIDIERALSLGAADYFTDNESSIVVIDKLRIALGEPVNSAENEVINIGTSNPEMDSSGIRVFLVEDDSLLANLLTTNFKKAKFPLHVNSNGKNILDEIDEFKPDILILDLMLPGISGFEILQTVRSSKNFTNLPVFIFSNRDSSEDRKKAAELGVSGFYVKAMTDLSDLVKNIEKEVNNGIYVKK